jgi:hypothetical protein
MLVRLKKRGEFPRDHCRNGHSIKTGSVGIEDFRGCCIEVESISRGSSYTCGADELLITDRRVTTLYPVDVGLVICTHWLIDDLDAYESDSNDEQAEVGDLALAECAAELAQKVKA